MKPSLPPLILIQYKACILLAFAALFNNPYAGASEERWRLHSSTELYSQNISSEYNDTKTVLYSETRLRLFPFHNNFIRPYLGAYSNPYSYGPSAGVLVPLQFKWIQQLQLLAEYRHVMQLHPAAGTPHSVDESRFGIIYGSWYDLANHCFLDSYAESIFIPRLSQTPVSTLFTRYGYRASVFPNIYLDPHLQLWGQLSNNADLAPGGLEVRPGLRLAWANSGITVAALAYYRDKLINKKTPNEWEGLLVIQGVLK